MTIRPEPLDELFKDYQSPRDLLGESGILKLLTNDKRQKENRSNDIVTL